MCVCVHVGTSKSLHIITGICEPLETNTKSSGGAVGTPNS